MKENLNELEFLFGELNLEESQRLLGELSADEASQLAKLKSAFSSLPTLNENIPDPQLSFARISDAIQQQSAAHSSGFAWFRPLPLGLAAAACTMLFVALTRLPLNFGSRSAKEPMIVASNDSKLSHLPSAGLNADLNLHSEIDSSPAKTLYGSVSEVKSLDFPTDKSSGPRVRYANRNRSSDERPSTRDSVDTKRSTNEVAPAADMQPGVGADVSVVVVTSTVDSGSGANGAVEVSKPNDIVLGS